MEAMKLQHDRRRGEEEQIIGKSKIERKNTWGRSERQWWIGEMSGKWREVETKWNYVKAM